MGEYNGYYIAQDGPYAGKIVERINGQEMRPLDLSITKTVFALLLNSLISSASYSASHGGTANAQSKRPRRADSSERWKCS